MSEEARAVGLQALKDLGFLIAEATPRRPPTKETTTLFRELFDRLVPPASEAVAGDISRIQQNLDALTKAIVFGERARPAE